MTIRSRFKFIHLLSVMLTALALGLSLQSARAAAQPIPVLLLDINPGWYNSDPSFGAELNGLLYFTAYSPEVGAELWRSDGTRSGTQLVKDIMPGVESGYPNAHPQFARYRNRLYFTASTPEFGWELWATDGTAAGTVMVVDINPGMESSTPLFFIVYGNRLYFTAWDADHGSELWSTDGTAAGTRLVADIVPGSADSYPSYFAVFQNRLYFSARDSSGLRGIWKTNGTANGTTMVYASGGTYFDVHNMTAAGSRLYFVADDGLHGYELWSTNGTAAGTGLVMDINTQQFGGVSYSSSPRDLTVFNGWLYFAANDGVHGTTIWRSNGTAASTKIFKDLDPTVTEEYADIMAVMGNALYFAGGTSYNTAKLWKTYGTAASTTVVSNRAVGIGGFSQIINGALYFIAYSGEAFTGPQIWSTRGTDTSTVMLGSLNYGDLPHMLFSAGGKLFIGNQTEAYGTELYVLERKPDLQVSLSNTSGGSVPNGGSWTWRLEVANTAIAQPASFATGQLILSNTLPRGPIYPSTTTITVLNGTLIGEINCTINASVLTCKAGQGGVTLDPLTTVEVAISGITAAPGKYTNPRYSTPSLCSIDPWLIIAETSETNNRCGLDTVTVTP